MVYYEKWYINEKFICLEGVKAIDTNKRNHILQAKHKWSKLVQNPKNPNNWNKIAAAIALALSKGTKAPYNGSSKVYINTVKIGNLVVQVTYKVVNGVKRISDAWIK